MAGDWIKMRADLFTHPKVVRISSALKADTLRTVGGLMSAWCLFDAHSVDGRLEGYTSEKLDEHLRWDGFAAAMIAVSWLDDDGESLSLPDFDTHNGESAKRRAQDADRKRRVRKESASETDKKRTREEKRREEKKDQEKPSRKLGEMTFATWTASLAGDDVIPASDPIFSWAADAGIPADWIAIAWWVFEDSYAAKPKKYADWRAAFRDHCKRDFLRVWRHDARENRFVLTTAGETARREMEATA